MLLIKARRSDHLARHVDAGGDRERSACTYLPRRELLPQVLTYFQPTSLMPRRDRSVLRTYLVYAVLTVCAYRHRLVHMVSRIYESSLSPPS